MSKDKLKKIIAVFTACLGISTFAFAGCNSDANSNTGDGDTVIDGGNQGGEQEPPENPQPENPEPPVGPKPEEPVIPSPPEGNVKITKASGNLEAGYAEWQAVQGADWYNVYVKSEGGSYAKLDSPLVRCYKTYYRADALGLKAGKYTIKVVPTTDDGTESENLAATADFTVLPHDRSGYAFVNGTSSGAYNDDGTLKSNANVIYITENTKNTVSLSVTGAASNPCVGLQAILDGYKKGKETKPLAVRLVGNITDLSYLLNGDLVIESKNNPVGITLEGVGGDATVNGWGVRVKNSSNVEIRNLGFMNCDSDEGDNIGLQQGNDHVWVHNCDLFYGHAGSDGDQAKGDGALDTKDSTYVTHSYNHFYDTGKSNLQGMKNETESNFITYHHNWYDHSDSRHPRIRTCTVHVYNNYFDGVAKYGVGATMGSSVFVEGNYFRSTAKLRPMLSSMQGTDISVPDENGECKGTFSGENGGIIKSFNNTYDCPADKLALLVKSLTKNDDAGKGVDAWEATSRDEKVPESFTSKSGGTTYNNFDTASDMYPYTATSPEQAKTDVRKFAGRIDGGDFKWQFDNAKDDRDFGIIAQLKAALVGYSSALEKVGGENVSGSGSDGGDENPDVGTLPAGVTKVEFLKDATYPAGITVNGNYRKDGHLKMESSTVVTVTVSEAVTVLIHTTGPSKRISIDGEKKTLDENGEIRLTLAAGKTLTIKKADVMDLEYILFEKN